MMNESQRKIVEDCRLERSRWIEEDCTIAPCGCPGACPYAVYDKTGIAKCDPKIRKEMDCD